MAFNEFPVKQSETVIAVNPFEKENENEDAYLLNEIFSDLGKRCRKMKPNYADTWVIGSPDDLEIIENYSTKTAEITIGYAKDGELEYNITPMEYQFDSKLNAKILEALEKTRNDFRKNGGKITQKRISELTNGLFEKDRSEIIERYTVGLGIFDILNSDSRLEDVYVDAPCEENRIHVTLNQLDGFNSHVKCRTNLITTKREIKNLINRLMKESGLPFCESSPVLETDMFEGTTRATVVGYPMSPRGDSVALRKHSETPWTLTKMIANGTIEPRIAGLLSFLIDNRTTMLICGARGAGKSSMLSALLFEFPISQRILTIEDTIELPGEKMRSLGFKVQSMLIDERLGGNATSRADDALRVSLRMGESAIVLGEVRGEEAKTLYQSMRTGKAGSSILGTIHGDSAKTVYERVVHDIGISPDAFMATDFLLTLNTIKDRGTENQRRSVSELVSVTENKGEFVDITNGRAIFDSPAMKRIMKNTSMNEKEIENEIEIRSQMRKYIAEMGKNYGDGFFGPEWIVFANDHMKKCISAGMTENGKIFDSFKNKFQNFRGVLQ